MKIIKISILILLSYLFLFYSCKEEKKDLTGKITFIKGQVFINSSKVKMGQTVLQNDTITVKDKSSAILQFDESAILTLKSNTVLKVQSLLRTEAGKPIVALFQPKGTSFSKIVPGKAKYSVSTPTVVAGVRGTSFKLVVTKNRKVQIQLLKGKVKVTPKGKSAEKSKEIVLEENEKISASDDGITESVKLSKADKKELTALNEIKVLPKEELNKIDSETTATNVVAEKTAEKLYQLLEEEVVTEKVIKKELKESKIIAKEEVKTKKVKKRKLTLADLKAKYGKLTQVTTKDGKVYIGIFTQAAKKMRIRTTKGVISLKSGDVIDIKPIK